ncbi:MAG: hypothetical protein JWM57_3966 [Phycisphaerales bacterium]|nr:hypothetical protein [Phycisphaerales bacterium]
MHKRWWQRTLLWVIAIPVAVFGALWGAFGYSSACRECGMIRSSTDWQIPFTPLTYWRSHSLEPTLLSREVEADALATGHTHNWVFSHGGGNGIMCAIGSGRWLMSEAMSPDCPTFIHGLVLYRDKRLAREWLTLLLDPKIAIHPPLGYDLPKKNFPNKAAFDEWGSKLRDNLSFDEQEQPGVAALFDRTFVKLDH